MGPRIPLSPWTAAGKVVAAYGIRRTASALRLDYNGLKKRVEQQASASQSSVELAKRSGFVELAPPVPRTPTGECTIEFEDCAGASIRVHLKGCETPDLVALGRSFWDVS